MNQAKNLSDFSVLIPISMPFAKLKAEIPVRCMIYCAKSMSEQIARLMVVAKSINNPDNFVTKLAEKSLNGYNFANFCNALFNSMGEPLDRARVLGHFP